MRHGRLDYQRIQDPAELIPRDEPVFLLRAQDAVAEDAVRDYARLCEGADYPEKFVADVFDHANRMSAWPKKKAADVPAFVSNPPKPHPEKILAVPRARFDKSIAFQGLHFLSTPSADDFRSLLFQPGIAQLRVRDECEGNPEWKQVIPYCYLRDPYLGQVAIYTRGDVNGDPRLQRMRSLGFGGHVEESDFADPHDKVVRLNRDGLVRAFEREVGEEILVQGQLRFDLLGVLNDDSDAVGRDHLGLVYKANVTPITVSAREHGIHDFGFVSEKLLRSMRWMFEGWSRILIDELLCVNP